MLTRRKRGLVPQKTEPTSFADRAKDLGALRDAVVDAASVGAGFWISYLFALFYFAIGALAVTHRDLLLESPVKLPFLNVELPLYVFFILGPLVVLIVHTYVLLHLVFLAGKISAYNAALQAKISWEDARAPHRRQLPSNIFVQYLAGPREWQSGTIGFLLWLIIVISLVAGPIALLIVFQLKFLPYHSESITWWQRIAVGIDLVLLWFLWPRITRRRAPRLRLLVIILPVLLVVTVATFPGEWLEENAPPVPGWATLHKLLFAGEVNYVTGRPQSLLSNVLVLPNFEVDDRVNSDAAGKVAVSAHGLSLRGRSLDGAMLAFAHLRNADFTGASLARANFGGADLREAKFECERIGGRPGFSPVGLEDKGKICAQLRGANFALAQLQGASLRGAQLQDAVFLDAQLQGADLDGAQLLGAALSLVPLQGASLRGTQLQGADLMYTQLQGANLDQAQLQGALLYEAHLQGASLYRVQLQGASLFDARLEEASLRNDYVWRTNPPSNANGTFVATPEPGPKYSGLDCTAVECPWSEKSYAALKSLIESSVSLPGRRDQVLPRLTILEHQPYVRDEVSAEAWTNLAKESARSAGSYFNTLAKILIEIGCAAEGAPYVINGLIRPAGVGLGRVAEVNLVLLDRRFEGNPSQEAEVAAAFLDDVKCPGARGLSEENKAKLREIRDRGLPAPPSPSAAAR
jgi:uncharacterized protein YjbI with pentapeptide repeats